MISRAALLLNSMADSVASLIGRRCPDLTLLFLAEIAMSFRCDRSIYRCDAAICPIFSRYRHIKVEFCVIKKSTRPKNHFTLSR